ncbi:MAG TPA: peptidylprolyl isomerase [Tepidisphaeraceae bacterium]|nr:peptidylprolyl isomerase [Tepidisphaeraceae bacterium]
MKQKKMTRLMLAVAAAAAIAVPLIAQTGTPAPDAGAPAAVAPAKPAVAPDTVVLTIGDEKITAKEFDDFISDLPPQVQAMAQGPARRMVADELVKVKLLAHEAEKRGLEKSPKFERQMVLMKDQLLASEVAADEQKSVDDAAVHKYYDDHKDEFEQVKARHILVRSGVPASTQPGAKMVSDDEAKAKAEAIRKRLVDGKEDFAKVAKAESDDKHSGEEGGSLGTFGHGQMVPEFEKAAFSLKPGEISPLVKTQFGYHIIQVEEKKTQPFDEVKDELTQKLGPDKVEKLAADLKKNTKVEMNDAYFGPPGATPPAGFPGAGGPPQQ